MLSNGGRGCLIIFQVNYSLAMWSVKVNLLLGQFPGINGFLGTRGSLMLDLVFLAMFVVVPVLWWSITLAKKGKYLLHKRVQVVLGLLLLVAVSTFEIEMRLVGWKERAMPSPYWSDNGWDAVYYALVVHLFFAIPTAILWLYVVIQALRKFPKPLVPNEHSRSHRFWAPLASFEMLMTAITGWIFYWVAFVASK